MLPLAQQTEEFLWLLRHRGYRGLRSELVRLAQARLPFGNRAQWLAADVTAVQAAQGVSEDFTVATQSDLPRLGTLVSPHTLREVASYVSCPERFACAVSPKSGEPTSHLFVSYESVTQAGITVNVPADAIYIFGGFTHPSARRRGLSRSALVYICRHLSRGRSTAWAWVDTENGAQRRILLALGFRPMGTDDLRTPLFGERSQTSFAPH